jgi:predicted transcriptional regulator
MQRMIILKETDSQMIPSALSKRIKEIEREFLLRSILKENLYKLFYNNNDQSNQIFASILS